MKLFMKSVGYSFRLIYRSSKWMILFYFALNLICTAFPLFSAFVLKYLIDILTADSPDMTIVILCVGLYIAALVILQGIRSARNILYDSVYKKAEHLYDCELSEKLEALPMSVIDTSEGQDLVDDVSNTKGTAIYSAFHIISIISLLYTFCVAFITLAAFNVGFSCLFIALTIPGIITDVVFTRKAESLRRKLAPDVRKFSYYRWMLTDEWPAQDVRMYDLTIPIKNRYDTEKDIYIRANKALDIKKLKASLLTEIIARSGEILFTVFVILQAMEGRLTVGNAVLYIQFAASIYHSFSEMTLILVNGYVITTDMMGRLFEFYDMKCPCDSTGIRKLNDFESLVFDNVSFKYPTTESYVLNGASFVLNRGDKLSIVGVNGSGKSTIVKLMLGLYQIDSGKILINGYPMSDYDIKDVHRLFSVLFQDFVKYPLTLRDNIALSDYERAGNDAEIAKALEQSGVYGELQEKLEDGLDSYMTRQFDDNGTELSRGQWQKVALSRAYFKNAPIIIFDEPSASLDAEAEDRIFKNFEAISDNRTGIMISHRISAAQMSNKILVLDDGKIAESGTHDELLAFGGLYSKLYNLQREKYMVREAQGYE